MTDRGETKSGTGFTMEELEMRVEELEERIAPGLTRNHNENLVRDTSDTDVEISVEVEELEAIIAPGRGMNHNETLVSDGES